MSKASIYCSRLVNCHSAPTPLYMLQYAFCYPLSSPLIMQIASSAFPSTQILDIISFYTEDRPKNEDDKVKNSEKRKAALRIKWLHSVISWNFSSNLFSKNNVSRVSGPFQLLTSWLFVLFRTILFNSTSYFFHLWIYLFSQLIWRCVLDIPFRS